MSASAPMFESLGFFDFERPPSPPTTSKQPRNDQADDDFDMEAELAMMQEEEMERRRRPLFDDPPPPMEEEEPDWEEDEAAMADAWAHDAAGSTSVITRTVTRTTTATTLNITSAAMGETESGRMTFGDSDIFDAPVASSSRLQLDTFRESIPTLAPAAPCNLPPLSAETAAGKPVAFKRRARPKMLDTTAEIEKSVFGSSNLLEQPLHHILPEVNEMRSKETDLKLQRRINPAQRVPATALSTVMWTDKYRPKKFSDLMGEERVHRDVIGWLKEWDKCVFRRANPPKKRKFDFEEQENIPIDPLGRPRDRILLLSGPPGYGKTTLAHIVAKQAGYKTLEINASDDRSAATVSTRIKNAIESGSGLASDGKPTCVVIDEIDGASGGGDTSFVRSLIKLIQDVPARRKSNTPAKPVRRPIICICNDLYATSLRPLRPYARVIRFRKPQPQLLVKRLRDICERETLSADMRVLTGLVEMTTGDVRSCLNTLQFIKSKSAVVTDEAIKSSSVGLKDSGTTLQSVWNDLFIPVSAKARRKTAGIDNGKFVNRLVHAVSSCGDHDRLVQGLFEHYPNLKPLDASLQNVCKVHDWVQYYDRLHGRISENQEFELMGYVSYAIVPWYSHMAAPANTTKPTEWPKMDYEAYQARTVNEEVATTMKNGIPAVLRSLFSSTTALTELIPLLMRIISPPLRPVNANIVKPAEKAVLDRLVELMIPLGLSFWQEKSESGQPMMRLEPPIDVFVHYDGKRADDIAASRFAVRQLVAQAIDAERARRKGGSETTTSGAAQLQGAYSNAKNGKAAVQPAAEVIATDFFGRTIVKAVPAVAEGDTEDVFIEQPKQKFRAVYKFNEGSSSAVRKPIKMSALM